MWTSGGQYREWAEFLDRWARGEPVDDQRLPRLFTTDLAPDTWARLSDLITRALDRRLRSWSAGLNPALNDAKDEFSYGRALTQARSGLYAIRALADHPGLPSDFREQLVGLVDGQIRSAQSSLEAGTLRMRDQGMDVRQVEARMRTVRNNPLTVVIPTPVDDAVSNASSGGPAGPTPPGSTDWLPGTDDPRRRRVIID